MTSTRPGARSALFGVTAPNTALAFLDGQLGHLVDDGLEVHLVCSDTPDGRVAAMVRRNGATFHRVSISRRPSLVHDVRALAEVGAVIRRTRPDTIVAGTPKMSLLLLLTGTLARVRRRVYLCHGLRFEGARGLRRRLLVGVERLLCALSTDVVAVSPSGRAALVALGVARTKVSVLGDGSANGIDGERFRPAGQGERVAARAGLALADERVAAFVGRLTHDKGIATVLACAEAMDDVTFLVAGHPEPVGVDDESVIRALQALPNVRLLGRCPDVVPVYAAADLLILPTVREGMPTVVLEAAACGVPAVAYSATGTVDAVLDGVTGRIVPQGDVAAFVRTVRHLLGDDVARSAMGRAAHDRVMERFAPGRVWRLWSAFLDAPGLPLRRGTPT